MDFILYGLFFITGYLVHASYTYVLTLGSSALSIKQSIDDCLLLLGAAYEKIIFVNEGTYQALIKKGIDEKEVELYRKMDKLELDSLMDVAVVNVKLSVPSRYKELMPYADWKSANKHLTAIAKRRNGLDNSR
jgi:hypothetical protein|tara:strand:+ start:329 stop:727 length:399 start_codon:yes stop_codon:yes gene_type:complete